MQYFLKALIFCSVGFFNFLLSNFDFVSDDVNIPFVGHKDVFVTLWIRSVNVSETLRFYVIFALSCQFFFAVITTYTNYVILKRF